MPGLRTGTKRTAPAWPATYPIWFFILAELFRLRGLLRRLRLRAPKTSSCSLPSRPRSTATPGALNTVLLLTASYFVVRAVQAAEAQASRQCANWLGGAIVTGFGFIIVKLDRIRCCLRAQHQPVEQHLPHVLPVADVLPLHARDPGPGDPDRDVERRAQGRYRPGDMNGWRPARRTGIWSTRLADPLPLFTSFH